MIADLEFLDRIAHATSKIKLCKNCKETITQHHVYLDPLSYIDTKAAWGIDEILRDTEDHFKIMISDGNEYHIHRRAN